MAKSKAPATPGLKAALKVVNQLGKSMTREADADYSVALSALTAGQQNLKTQTRALTRDLISGQLGKTTSLRRLAAEAAAREGVVNRQQQGTVSRYGGALGQQVARDFGVARAGAAGTGALGASALRAGKQTMGAAQTVAGIAKAGVLAQKQAAVYGLSQALQQRAIIDNQTLAGLTGQLYQSALQYNAQMAMYERQRADALKDARKAANQEAAAQLDKIGGEVPDLAFAVSTALNEWDGPEEGAVTGAVTAWAEDQGISPEDPRYAVAMEVARRLHNGQDLATATEGALDFYYGSFPGYDKWIQSGVISSGLDTLVTQDFITSVLGQGIEAFGMGGEANTETYSLASADTRGEAEMILISAGVPAEDRARILGENGF